MTMRVGFVRNNNFLEGDDFMTARACKAADRKPVRRLNQTLGALGALALVSLSVALAPASAAGTASAAARARKAPVVRTAPADFCFLNAVCVGEPAESLLGHAPLWLASPELDWIKQGKPRCDAFAQRVTLEVKQAGSKLTYPLHVELYPTSNELHDGKLQWNIVRLSMLKPGNFADEDVITLTERIKADKGPLVVEDTGLFQPEKKVHVAINKTMSATGGSVMVVDFRLDHVTPEGRPAMERAIRLQPACASPDLPQL